MTSSTQYSVQLDGFTAKLNNSYVIARLERGAVQDTSSVFNSYVLSECLLHTRYLPTQ